MVNGPKHCRNLHDSNFMTFIDQCETKKYSGKKSLLVLCKILALFVNTLTADDKYSLFNCGKLMQQNPDAII